MSARVRQQARGIVSLQDVVRQFRRNYPGCEVAIREDGPEPEAWVLAGDMIFAIRADLSISFRFMTGDWQSADMRAVTGLTPAQITTIKNWARANNMPLPMGMVSLTPELVSAYFAQTQPKEIASAT